jgi:hypothetical protein
MNLPWISRKRYINDVYELEESLGSARFAIKSERRRHEAEIEKLKEQHQYEVDKIFKPVAAKICRTRLDSHREPIERYALQIAIDDHWIQAVLDHGNSDREIQSLARIVADDCQRQLSQLIRALNMRRALK